SGAQRHAPARSRRAAPTRAAPAAPPAPTRRGSLRRYRPAGACRDTRATPASADRRRTAPPPPRPRPGVPAARPGCGPAADGRPPRGTAWESRHRSACRARPREPPPRPGPSLFLRRRNRRRQRTRLAVLHHAIEHFARLDHPQFAARAFLGGGHAFLEVTHLGGQGGIALLQAAVLAALAFHLRRQCG